MNNNTTDLNQVNLQGTIESVPRITETKNGRKKLFFRLATTLFEIRNDGKEHAKTDWHSVISFDITIIENFEALKIGEGARVALLGKNRSSKYETVDGRPAYGYDVELTAPVTLKAKPMPNMN